MASLLVFLKLCRFFLTEVNAKLLNGIMPANMEYNSIENYTIEIDQNFTFLSQAGC